MLESVNVIPIEAPAPMKKRFGPQVDKTKRIMMISEEQERATKRKMRIASCGSCYWQMTARTGGSALYKTRCGCADECAICRGEKIDEVKNRLKKVMEEWGKVKMLKVSNQEEQQKLGRRLKNKGAEYLWIPQSDGTIQGFVSSENCDWSEWEAVLRDECLAEENFYQFEDLNKLDWNEMLKLPEGRQRSGKLGKANAAPTPDETDDDESETIEVFVPQWKFAGLLAQEARTVYQKAMKFQRDNVQLWRPGIEPAASLTIAIKQTMAALKKYAREAGGKFLVIRNVKQRCKVKQVIWNCSMLNSTELVDLFPQEAFTSPLVLQERAEKALSG